MHKKMSNATFVTCILYSKDARFAKTHSEVKLHLLLATRFAVEPQSENSFENSWLMQLKTNSTVKQFTKGLNEEKGD